MIKLYNDDCFKIMEQLKEENELVIEAGEFFGKMCGSKAMSFAKEIILGN